MNIVTNRYRYTVTTRRGTFIEKPLGESEFTIAWERETDGKLDYSLKLPSQVTFRGSAYSQLLRLEKSIYRCDFMTLKIERRCLNNDFVTWFTGRFNNNDASWDLDRCEVNIKMDDTGPDACIENNKDQEINIFSANGRRTVLISSANYILEKVDYTFASSVPTDCFGLPIWPSGSTPEAGAWALYAVDKATEYNTSGQVLNCNQHVFWARETVLLPCGTSSPGPEWIVITDGCPSGNTKWARPARTFGCIYTVPDYNFLIQHTGYACKIIGDTNTVVSIDNGVALDRLFEAFLVQIGCGTLTVVSNFFQINPDVVSTINYVTSLRSKTMFITVFQKSDVKRPDDSGNASIGMMSFDNLLTGLVNMFNVRWFVDGNVLRIEHVSFFTRAPGLNLTVPKYAKWVVGSRKYTYATNAIPQRETFSFSEASIGDFAGVDIVYKICVTQGKDAVKNYQAENITTDVELCLGNPDPDSEIVKDEGFVFMGCDYDGTNYFIITEMQILGGDSLNNSMAWAQLQRDYWKWDRPVKTGNMNNVDTEFITVQPTKKGAQIVIPLDCTDDFNPNDTITTPLGVGTVDKASFSFKSETVALDLLYEANDDLVSNDPPVANPFTAVTALNVPVTIDAIPHATDDDGQVFGVGIHFQALHGVVTVTTDNKFIYTPTTGYTGIDVFSYVVFDDWGEPSAPALISVNVNATNLPPVARPDSYTTNKNTVLNVAAPGVFANDTDDTSFTLDTYDAASVHGGTVVVHGDGSIIYTPATGYVGSDSFTYRIIDGGALTSATTVTIDVRDPLYPTAVDDHYETVRNTNVVVAAPGVLGNDINPGGPMTAGAGTFATSNGGSVVMATDGSFTYTPPSGYTGPDSVNYTATNSSGSDTGVLSFYVLPPIYIKLQPTNLKSQPVTSFCSGHTTTVGEQRTENVRLLFYSNSGGTTPIDVTGFSLVVNIRKGTQTVPAGGVTNTDTAYGAAGSVQDVLVDYMYYSNFNFCDGTLANYLNETFTLLPGLYTII